MPQYNRSEHREISYDEGLDFANSVNAQYIEVSLKTRHNLEPLFQAVAEELIEAKWQYRVKLMQDKRVYVKRMSLQHLKYITVTLVSFIWTFAVAMTLCYILSQAFFSRLIPICTDTNLPPLILVPLLSGFLMASGA